MKKKKVSSHLPRLAPPLQKLKKKKKKKGKEKKREREKKKEREGEEQVTSMGKNSVTGEKPGLGACPFTWTVPKAPSVLSPSSLFFEVGPQFSLQSRLLP